MAKGENRIERASAWVVRATGIPEQYIPQTVIVIGVVNQVSGLAAQAVFWGTKSLAETSKIIENKTIGLPSATDILSTTALAIIWGDFISLALPALTLFAMKRYFENDRRLGVSDFFNKSIDGINLAVEMGYL